MKIAVEDDCGQVRIHRRFPGAEARQSRLSHALPAARKFHCSADGAWPGSDPLPPVMEFSAKNPVPAYPALTLEGDRIARELFLDEAEARSHHDRAILLLWKQTLPQILKPLRNLLRPTPRMELEYFLHYPDWKEELIELAIRAALGGDLWKIRSAEEFAARLESSRDQVAERTAKRFEQLEQLDPQLHEVRERLKRLRPGSPAVLDAEQELRLYFRPGFFRTPELLDRTMRYLKALEIRLRRAFDSPEKDRSKGEFLESFIRKFRIAEEAVKGVENSSGLLDFLLLLEEARIAVYAPEIRPLVKCSEKILAQAWQELKLK